MINYPDNAADFQKPEAKRVCMPLWLVIVLGVLVAAGLGVGIWAITRSKTTPKTAQLDAKTESLKPAKNVYTRPVNPDFAKLRSKVEKAQGQTVTKTKPQTQPGYWQRFKTWTLGCCGSCLSCCFSKKAVVKGALNAALALSVMPPKYARIIKQLNEHNKEIIVDALLPIVQEYQDGNVSFKQDRNVFQYVLQNLESHREMLFEKAAELDFDNLSEVLEKIPGGVPAQGPLDPKTLMREISEKSKEDRITKFRGLYKMY